jgi:hypothetical protein
VTACPICGANASFSPTASRNSDVDCPRCGPYHITHEALSALQGNFIRKVPIRWAITSHALRRTGSTPERRFLVQQSWLIAVWETDRLPNPQQQADYFIDYLGQSARAPDQWIACRPIEIAGLVGSGDDPTKGETSGFVYLADHLSAEHLISSRSSTAGGTVDYRLTFRGWSRFEDIRLARVDSNVAFMAMGYGNLASLAESTAERLHGGQARSEAHLLHLPRVRPRERRTSNVTAIGSVVASNSQRSDVARSGHHQHRVAHRSRVEERAPVLKREQARPGRKLGSQ